eukprot:362519-Chlamydomonas_euryale.AAC.5
MEEETRLAWSDPAARFHDGCCRVRRSVCRSTCQPCACTLHPPTGRQFTLPDPSGPQMRPLLGRPESPAASSTPPSMQGKLACCPRPDFPPPA